MKKQIEILLVIYFLFVIFIIGWSIRIPEKRGNKIILGLLCFLTAIIFPVWDIPIINWKFEQLCKNEAGNHVYEEVVLASNFWKKDGTLKFLPTRELKKVIPNGYEITHDLLAHYSSITRVRKTRYQIKRKVDEKILGERITIHKTGGWLAEFIGLSSWSTKKYDGTCPNP